MERTALQGAQPLPLVMPDARLAERSATLPEATLLGSYVGALQPVLGGVQRRLEVAHLGRELGALALHRHLVLVEVGHRPRQHRQRVLLRAVGSTGDLLVQRTPRLWISSYKAAAELTGVGARASFLDIASLEASPALPARPGAS